jgi:hypothetical protein
MGFLDGFLNSMAEESEVKRSESPEVDDRLTEPYLRCLVQEKFKGSAYREAMTRLDKELNDLEENDPNGLRRRYYSLMLLVSSIAYKYAYPIYFRDKETGSLIAFLLDLTCINPLSRESGGCEIPYKGEEARSLEVSVVPALLYIITNAIKKEEGLSYVAEKIRPNSVQLRLGFPAARRSSN